MKNIVKRKLHINYGFTLAETLLAVLILLMVSSIVAAGIPSASRAYEKVVLTSNAEVLLSTTVSMLRNELGTAMDVKANGSEITYYNTARGATSKISLGSVLDTSPVTEPGTEPGTEPELGTDNTIVLFRYFGDYVYNSAAEKIAMSSSSSRDKDLYVTYTSVRYANGIITFDGLSVNQVSGNQNLASLPDFSIRLLTE